MTSLQAAALWVGLNAFLLIFLSAQVGVARAKYKINLGHDGNLEMLKRARAQGNYIEYAPAALGGLILLALLNVAPLFIHLLGATFLGARILHFLGLGMGVMKAGRALGTMLTMVVLLLTGGALIYFAFFG